MFWKRGLVDKCSEETTEQDAWYLASKGVEQDQIEILGSSAPTSEQ